MDEGPRHRALRRFGEEIEPLRRLGGMTPARLLTIAALVFTFGVTAVSAGASIAKVDLLSPDGSSVLISGTTSCRAGDVIDLHAIVIQDGTYAFGAGTTTCANKTASFTLQLVVRGESRLTVGSAFACYESHARHTQRSATVCKYVTLTDAVA